MANKMVLDDHVKSLISKAKESAAKGDVLDMEYNLNCASGYARARLGEDIGKEYWEIKRAGYAAAVPLRIEAARKKAAQGGCLDSILEEIKEYARLAGIKAPDEIEEIRKTGALADIQRVLGLAKTYATEGKAEEMEEEIDTAAHFAEKEGQNISSQVDEIRSLLKQGGK